MVCWNAQTLALVLAATSVVTAHPGEVHDMATVRSEIELRNSLATMHKRSLAACSNSLKARALNERSIARRAEKAKTLRAARGLAETSKSTAMN